MLFFFNKAAVKSGNLPPAVVASRGLHRWGMSFAWDRGFSSRLRGLSVVWGLPFAWVDWRKHVFSLATQRHSVDDFAKEASSSPFQDSDFRSNFCERKYIHIYCIAYEDRYEKMILITTCQNLINHMYNDYCVTKALPKLSTEGSEAWVQLVHVPSPGDSRGTVCLATDEELTVAQLLCH